VQSILRALTPFEPNGSITCHVIDAELVIDALESQGF
jgi:hypothetical protein